MKTLKALVFFVAAGTILATWTGQLLADEKQAMETAKRELKTEERDLRDFKNLVSELERYVVESSNANRRRVIYELQDMMVDEILAVEKRVAKVHKIQQHGVDPRDKDRQAAAKEGRNTLPGEKSAFQKDYKTGGGTSAMNKPLLSRLTQMQSIYRVCTRIREPAIKKHERGVPAYIQRVHEFSRLWDMEMRTLRKIAYPEPVQSNVNG